MRYVVEINHCPPDLPAYVREVARIFATTPEKARCVLRRLPGPVTRPMDLSLANEMAKRFNSLGLNAVVRAENLPTALEIRDVNEIEFDHAVYETQEQMYTTMLGVEMS